MEYVTYETEDGTLFKDDENLNIDYFILNGERIRKTPYTIPNLSGNKYYEYELQAFNAKGVLVAEATGSWMVTEGLTTPCTTSLVVKGAHVFEFQWSKDEFSHWHASSCNHAVVADKENHSFNGTICTVCQFDSSILQFLAFNYLQETDSYSVSCKDKALSYAEIPSAYNGKPITSIADEAFFSCDELISITLPSSITSIGYRAFAFCKELTTVIISEGVTSIGDGAFQSCSKLFNVILPSSLTYLGRYSFESCSELINITVPKGVESIGFATFGFCYKLSNVKLSDGLMEIGEMAFMNCENLGSITIPPSVKNIDDHAFADCSGLTNITISEGVTTVGSYIISGCNQLKSVSIPSSLTSIDNSAFTECENLEVIKVSAENSIFYSEGNCIIEKKSKRLILGCNNSVIPDGVIIIGRHSFQFCNKLKTVIIPPSVKTIENEAFVSCSGIERIEVFGVNTTYYAENNCLIEKNTKKLILGCKNSIIPTNVGSIGDSAFSGCHELTKITIPINVTSIEDAAFINCTGLTNIVISEKVTNIGAGAFFNCKNLKNVVIPTSVTSIEFMAFGECPELKNIIFKGTRSEWESISKDGSGLNSPFLGIIHCTDGDLQRY